MNEENLTYTDEEGNKLYGYSQKNLDSNTRWIKAVVAVLSLLLLYIVWLTYYIIKNNVINNIVSKCIC